MAHSIVSNFAANVAQRNLRISSEAASESIAKLSSGSRVNSAKDDAASLAIGSRLRAEVAALKTASVNASQAGSLLQIADGALSTVSDILIRLKELAVQASSGQFSSVERGVLDSEFQALTQEITRISQDTEFNGTALIAGGASTATLQSAATNFGASGNGFSISVDPTLVADNNAFRLNYEDVAAVAQVSEVTIAIGGGVLAGEVFTISVTDNAAGATYVANYTVLADAETAETIEAGLITAINNVVGVTVTAANGGAGVVQLTANTAGNGFSTVNTENSGNGTLALATSVANVVGGEFLTVTNLTNAASQTINISTVLDGVASAGAGNNLVQTETATISFASLGVDITVDANFDRNTSNLSVGDVPATASLVNAAPGTLSLVNDADGGVLNDAITALLASGAYDSATGLLTLTVAGGADVFTVEAAGIAIGVNGGAANAVGAASADLDDDGANSAGTIELSVVTANGTSVQLGVVSGTDFQGAGGVSTGSITVNLGDLLFGADVAAGSSTQSFSFKVGSGSESFDSLTFSVSAASANALGVLGTSQGGSIGITTAALADTASAAVSAAIDTLNQTRSDIGAAQNRLTFAANNLASAIENAEAARSGLLDLDVAAEISTFTSKQILVQTGVSSLAQANQLPQNLLRLFQ